MEEQIRCFQIYLSYEHPLSIKRWGTVYAVHIYHPAIFNDLDGSTAEQTTAAM